MLQRQATHDDVQIKFVQGPQDKVFSLPTYPWTRSMKADIFTKALTATRALALSDTIGISELSVTSRVTPHSSVHSVRKEGCMVLHVIVQDSVGKWIHWMFTLLSNYSVGKWIHWMFTLLSNSLRWQ